MSNQLVDATDWKNEQLLIDERYLRPATAQDLANVVEVDEPVSKTPKAKAKKPARRAAKR